MATYTSEALELRRKVNKEYERELNSLKKKIVAEFTSRKYWKQTADSRNKGVNLEELRQLLEDEIRIYRGRDKNPGATDSAAARTKTGWKAHPFLATAPGRTGIFFKGNYPKSSYVGVLVGEKCIEEAVLAAEEEFGAAANRYTTLILEGEPLYEDLEDPALASIARQLKSSRHYHNVTLESWLGYVFLKTTRAVQRGEEAVREDPSPEEEDEEEEEALLEEELALEAQGARPEKGAAGAGRFGNLLEAVAVEGQLDADGGKSEGHEAPPQAAAAGGGVGLLETPAAAAQLALGVPGGLMGSAGSPMGATATAEGLEGAEEGGGTTRAAGTGVAAKLFLEPEPSGEEPRGRGKGRKTKEKRKRDKSEQEGAGAGEEEEKGGLEEAQLGTERGKKKKKSGGAKKKRRAAEESELEEGPGGEGEAQEGKGREEAAAALEPAAAAPVRMPGVGLRTSDSPRAESLDLAMALHSPAVPTLQSAQPFTPRSPEDGEGGRGAGAVMISRAAVPLAEAEGGPAAGPAFLQGGPTPEPKAALTGTGSPTGAGAEPRGAPEPVRSRTPSPASLVDEEAMRAAVMDVDRLLQDTETPRTLGGPLGGGNVTAALITSTQAQVPTEAPAPASAPDVGLTKARTPTPALEGLGLGEGSEEEDIEREWAVVEPEVAVHELQGGVGGTRAVHVTEDRVGREVARARARVERERSALSFSDEEALESEE